MGAHVWGPDYLPRPPAAQLAPDGLVARLVRRLPRVPVLHGGPVADGRVGARRDLRCCSSCPPPCSPPRSRLSGWCTSRLYRWRKLLLVVGLVGLRAGRPGPVQHRLQADRQRASSRCRSRAGRSAEPADLPFAVPQLWRSAALPFVVDREPVPHLIRRQHRVDDGGRVRLLDLAVVRVPLPRRRGHAACAPARYAGAGGSVLFAACALCHVIPFFFVLACAPSCCSCCTRAGSGSSGWRSRRCRAGCSRRSGTCRSIGTAPT